MAGLETVREHEENITAFFCCPAALPSMLVAGQPDNEAALANMLCMSQQNILASMRPVLIQLI